MSTMMEQPRAPFKVLLGHGLVRDQKGEEMHKSKGNSIPFDGAAEDGYDVVLQAEARREATSWPKEAARGVDRSGGRRSRSRTANRTCADRRSTRPWVPT